MAFADKLKVLMTAKGVSQVQLVSDMQMTIGAYNGWIHAGRLPYPNNLERLADYFGVTTEELLDGTVPSRRQRGLVAPMLLDSISLESAPCSLTEKMSYLCELRGISPTKVAKDKSISVATMMQVVQGSVARMDIMQAIADYFRIPVWVLLDNTLVDFSTLSTMECRRYSVYNVSHSLMCLRAMLGFKMSDMATLLHVASATLKSYEIQRSLCSVDTLHLVCEAFDSSAQELTSNMYAGSRVHEWFAQATAFQRLEYIKIIRGIKLGDISVKIGLPQNQLAKLYSSGEIPTKIAEKTARYLEVPLEWVYGEGPCISEDTEIK